MKMTIEVEWPDAHGPAWLGPENIATALAAVDVNLDGVTIRQLTPNSAAALTHAELRETGVLQEVNRAFFHPYGLALGSVFPTDVGDLSQYAPMAVFDHRDDVEGVTFRWENSPGGPEAVLERARRVREESARRKPAREAALGYWQQPLP